MVTINTSNQATFARLLQLYAGYEKRKLTEVPFIESIVPNKSAVILDAACGSGPTSIGLLEAGYTHVVSNEIDSSYILLANNEAAKRGFTLSWTRDDWRTLSSADSYDAILLHGNSFTYLFEEHDRLTSLHNFRRALRQGGVLSVDSRNYPRILREGLTHSGDIMYCGIDEVVADVPFISDDKIMIQYIHKRTGEHTTFEGYPFKEGELEREIRDAGFRDVRVFGDFKPYRAGMDPEFFTYVARK